MNLKLALHRSAGIQDIVVAVDPGVRVGDLADRVSRADPRPDPFPSGPRTFAMFASDGWVTLPEDAEVAESGLRSGVLATVVAAGQRLHTEGSTQVIASVEVVSGPDGGREFPLRAGSWTIGRGELADIRLTDPLVSKRHALLRVGHRLHITDQNSANGIQIGGATLAWTDLTPDTELTLGDTVLRVVRLAPADDADGADGADGGDKGGLAFNRPPRVEPVYQPLREEVPEPPERPVPQPFPIFSMLIPVLLGVALWFATRSLLSAAFLALSPLLLIGSLMEQGLFGRRAFRRARRAYRQELSIQRDRFTAAAAADASARRAQHPAPDELRRAITGRTSLLWSRRPGRDGFGQLRAGTATLPSRNVLELPARQANQLLLQEARQVVADLALLPAVPVVVDLNRAGSLGISGPGRADIVRAIVLQLVTTHSPEDLKVTALLAEPESARWAWLRWLPHLVSPAAFGGASLGADYESCQRIVSAALELLGARARSQSSAPKVWTPRLVVVVEDGAPVDRGLLSELAERGASAGIHLIWSAATPDRLPAACRAYVDVRADGTGTANDALGGTVVHDVRLEGTDGATADALARALSPVVDACAATDRQAELPRSASFLEVAGHDLLTDSAAIADRWRETGSPGSGGAAGAGRSRTLRALVGVSAGAPFHLDLREHGPHALVGGTTGSGKSEFLQSWILGMAANHSPQRVTFLLVDYKGGAAFAEIVRLPHTVGLVTDLTPRLVSRALTSLKAELRYRERILNEAGAPDLLELERRGYPGTPPALVIVVDEFAALVQEVPEFVDGVIDIAARGRSLGLHLILATQRPAGVIKDNLRANTNLRVALRVADADDSIDVLGTGEAALFDPAIPGRAMAKTGPGRVTPFQALYAGGRSADGATPPEISITTLGFGRPDRWENTDTADHAARQDGPTDVHRLVDAIGASATRGGLPAARRPWLPQLPPVIDLADLSQGQAGDDTLLLGVADDPAHQRRIPALYRPDVDGAVLFLGTGGAGKSAALRTLAMSAGAAGLPDNQGNHGVCHVYGLDFGSRGLAPLEGLPHVGSIVAGDDHERVVRLLDQLRAVVDERAVRYAAASASTIAEYRQLADPPDASGEPRILLLLDNFGAFRAEYETGRMSRLYDGLLALAADGRATGVHLAVTADRPGVIPPGLSAAIQKRVILKLVADVDLASTGLHPDSFGADSPPGRAFADGLELQIAVPAGDPNIAGQAARLRQLGDDLTSAGARPAPVIGRLEQRIVLTSLPPEAGGRPTLGVAGDRLCAAGFDTAGTFLVAGPPQSGRTTTMLTIAQTLQRSQPARRLAYAGLRSSPLLSGSDHRWAQTATTIDDVVLLAEAWAQLADPAVPAAFGIVIENVPDFMDTAAQEPLERLIAAFAAAGHLVAGDGESTAFTSSWGLSKAMKAGRHGLLLQPDQADGDSILRTDLPRLSRAEFPPGRGVYVRSGQVRTIQVALPS